MTTVNLMTPRARFAAAAARISHGWAIAIGLMIVGLVPVGAIAWARRIEVVRQHEAAEAQYEPFRRLAGATRNLNAQAVDLVTNERTALTLAAGRPVGTLLAVIAEAISAAEGEAFVERLVLHDPPGSARAAPGAANASGSQVTLYVAATLGYDVSLLVHSLERAPVTAAKVISTETIDSSDVPHKLHVIQCDFE